MKRILGAHLEKGSIIAHPGMFSERRDDQAGFTGSRGEAQDPGGKATEGPILAQPPDVCSNSQKGLRMGGQPHVVTRSLSLQVTTLKGDTEKRQALLNDI